MSSNKDIIKHYMKELWENKNLAIIDEVFADDAIIHSPFSLEQGALTMKEIANKWLNAFPDFKMDWEDFIAEGNKVVCRWWATGTHMGSFFETNPTHQEVSFSGVATFELLNGKVAEYWVLVDIHALLQQLEGYETLTEALD